ncbi:MAG: winged helix-turn-helix domain-containing protein [Chloroflexi bacterium]|nr:winged helix-turn-helix domain-containing protein [Chloroflexota bacterium]
MSHNIARLLVRAGLGRVGQEILLTEDVTTLGRAASCQVIIDNDFASRRHAQIVRRDEVYWLRDLDSKNGTLLDTTRTQPNLAASAALLRVDAGARQVWLHGQVLAPPLTAKQFDLLLYLSQRAGEAVSKDELAAAVWPEDQSEAVYDYQIDKMVSRVRERIGKEWIETVWGFGYRLRKSKE